MTARTSFARSLAVALLAGLATPAVVLALAPFLGGERAVAAAIVLLAAPAVAALAPRPRERAQVALLALALGAAALALAPSPGFGSREGAFLAAAAVVAVCRGACFGTGPRARIVAVELALAAGGLALARAVSGPGLLGAALGVWAFHLVQALHPLFAAGRPRDAGREGGAPDAFERARARLDAWLEDDGTGG